MQAQRLARGAISSQRAASASTTVSSSLEPLGTGAFLGQMRGNHAGQGGAAKVRGASAGDSRDDLALRLLA
eukprot:9472386-Pyramimonas_sp.AAC.1